MIDITPGEAALDAHGARGGVDADALHVREVDHQPAIAGAQAGAVVPTPAYGQCELVLAREADSADHVGHTDTAREQRGSFVDHGVVDLAGIVVAYVARLDQLAAQSRCEILNRRIIQCGRRVLLLSHRALLLCANMMWAG